VFDTAARGEKIGASDALAENILECIGSPIDFRYLLLYGSSVRTAGPTRDIDALLVLPAGDNRFVRASLLGKPLNLHIVTEAAITEDLLEDRYGWIFLTKYLDDFRVLLGDQKAAEHMRAQAYLRLLGQWTATHSTLPQPTAEEAFAGILDTLKNWNPQFQVYVNKGLIDPLRYRRYFLDDWPHLVAKTHFLDLRLARLDLRPDSPYLRKADLRVVLLRYWTYYIAYQLDSRRYLSPVVADILARKGIGQ
jgi:hypothetical protein